jgi:hypothetical protein
VIVFVPKRSGVEDLTVRVGDSVIKPSTTETFAPYWISFRHGTTCELSFSLMLHDNTTNRSNSEILDC